MDYGTLTFTSKSTAPQQFTLRRGSMTIGRAPENDIVLDDENVARIHLRLFCTQEGCWVTDLASTTGTFLNQVRLQPHVRHPLRDGDILRIGSFTIRYNLAAAWFTPEPTLAVLPPEVAATLPAVRRLRGNGGPPRMQRELPQKDGGSSYLQYLPPSFHEDDFLSRFLLIFESILDPLERTVDSIDLYFDPRLAPEPLLPWLASWFDLVLNEKWPIERRRALVHAAADLYRWRGTRRGLREYLRIYTGVEPTIVEPGQEQRSNGSSPLPAHVFRVVLEVPDPDQVERELVEAIIEAEKPAHTAYILELRRANVARA